MKTKKRGPGRPPNKRGPGRPPKRIKDAKVIDVSINNRIVAALTQLNAVEDAVKFSCKR